MASDSTSTLAATVRAIKAQFADYEAQAKLDAHRALGWMAHQEQSVVVGTATWFCSS